MPIKRDVGKCYQKAVIIQNPKDLTQNQAECESSKQAGKDAGKKVQAD